MSAKRSPTTSRHQRAKAATVTSPSSSQSRRNRSSFSLRKNPTSDSASLSFIDCTTSPSGRMSMFRQKDDSCDARSRSLSINHVPKSSSETTSTPLPSPGAPPPASNRTSRPAANMSAALRRSIPGNSTPTYSGSNAASAGLSTSDSHFFGAYNRRISASSSTSNMPCLVSYQRCIGSSLLPPKRHGRLPVTCAYK